MTKTEKIFNMIKLIKEYPDLTVKDLARLCYISERGIYRYLHTLSEAGILVRCQNGGYSLQEDHIGILDDIFRETSTETSDAVRLLLSLGMQICEDDGIVERGKTVMKLIEESLPELEKLRRNEIEILPERAPVASYGGTVTIGHSSKPDIINPILTSETISVALMNLVFSDLVKFGSTGKPIPDLAKRWEVSNDGLAWTFFLRDDVVFHDGHRFTAHDVEFTYRAILDPDNESLLAERYGLVDEIETEGDHIFRVILKHPFAPFIHWLGRPIAPRHLLENVDLHNTPFNRCPIGSGPFKVADWTEDDTIILEANREYFQKGRPVIDRLLFRTYPDRETALQALSRGEMDITLNLTASDLLSVSRRKAFRVYSAPVPLYYAIIFDLADPLFRDIRVRKALDYAIDNESVIRNQLKGHSKICTGPFDVNSWAHNTDVKPNLYNPETAKKLLEQAGWRDTDENGVLERNGEPFEISLTVPNISDGLERIAVAIRTQLMRVGVRVKLIYADDSRLHKTPFQAIIAMVAAGADPDCAYRVWHSESRDLNLASYENRFVDDLLELGRRTTDLEKRKVIYHKIHRMIHDDYPAIFLASACEFIGSNYRFTNARFSSAVHFLTTMKDWQIVSGGKEATVPEYQRKINRL